MLPSKLHLRELCVLPFIEVINFENYLRRENVYAETTNRRKRVCGRESLS